MKNNVQVNYKSDNITDFERQFVDAYFTNGFNGRLAYRTLKPDSQANTADTESSKILSLPKVQNLIEDKREAIRKTEEIKLSFIIEELLDVVKETKGDPDKKIKPDHRNRISALAQLSKIAGFETKKIDITSKGESIVWNEEKSYVNK